MQGFIESESFALRILQPFTACKIDKAQSPRFLTVISVQIHSNQPMSSRRLPIHPLLSHSPLLQPDVDDLVGLLNSVDANNSFMLHKGLFGFLH